MADELQEVYSLMIPTVQGNILLPNSNVAEIVPFSNVELFQDMQDFETSTSAHLRLLYSKKVSRPWH